MKVLSKAILAALVAVMIGGTIALASAGSAVATSSRTADQVKGPCDEAEHANDARCDGIQVPEDRNSVHAGGGADDRGQTHERETGDNSGRSGEMEARDNSGRSEIEAGDDSGRSGEAEVGDESGHFGSANSGHTASDSGHGSDNSGRDHSEDD
jgi:hypothetical protein